MPGSFLVSQRARHKKHPARPRERTFVRREGEKLRNLLVDVFPNKMKNSLLLKVPGARWVRGCSMCVCAAEMRNNNSCPCAWCDNRLINHWGNRKCVLHSPASPSAHDLFCRRERAALWSCTSLKLWRRLINSLTFSAWQVALRTFFGRCSMCVWRCHWWKIIYWWTALPHSSQLEVSKKSQLFYCSQNSTSFRTHIGWWELRVSFYIYK